MCLNLSWESYRFVPSLPNKSAHAILFQVEWLLSKTHMSAAGLPVLLSGSRRNQTFLGKQYQRAFRLLPTILRPIRICPQVVVSIVGFIRFVPGVVAQAVKQAEEFTSSISISGLSCP